jgi:Fe-S oxidoreductase
MTRAAKPPSPAPNRSRPRLRLLAVWAALAGVAAAGAAVAAELPADVPHRQVYFNITGAWVIYVLLAMLVATLLWVPFQRARLWLMGRPVSPTDNPAARLRNLIVQGLAQHRVRRDRFAAAYHLLIFLSIVNLFIVTTILLIDSEIITPLTGEPLLQGRIYKAYSLYGDLSGFAGIAGVLMAFYRRYLDRTRANVPTHYIENRDRVTWRQNWTDHAILWLLFWLLVGGFVIEGARIAATELREGHQSWAIWSPGGWAIGRLMNAVGLSASAELAIHRLFWWTHMPVVFVWLGLIAFTKLGHIFLAPANAFFKSLKPSGYLPYDLDLTEDEAPADRETFGVGRVQDFTWKQLFEADVCVRCGRCSSACPAHIAGQPLSPMLIIQQVKEEMTAVGPLVLEARAAGTEEPGAGSLIERVTEEQLWTCRTCGACVQECPVFIEHIPTIVDMRRWLAMDAGRMPETALQAVQNIEQRGHPWRGTAFTRTSWMDAMDVPRYDGTQEYLYWVGCTGALVERALSITQSVVRLLMEANVSFGVIGAQETCNGDPARRLGNEYLYQVLVKQNIETFNALGVRKVIVHCPHCFNTFRNEYPEFGAKIEVVHHSKLLDHLVKAGRLQPKRSVAHTITFHDPCYLGRHNGIYEEPRGVIEALPGAKLVEMPRNRSMSYCCGAGGGSIWMEERKGRRVNHVRTEEAIATGADAVAVACPFCIQMFEDAIPSLQPDETRRMKAYDIAELLEVAVIDKSIAQGRAEAAQAGD